jgi:hypothetical protein
MGTSPQGKTQLNVYLPDDLNDHITEVHERIGISKSDFVALLVAYARTNFSDENIKQLVQDMMILGPSELRLVV